MDGEAVCVRPSRSGGDGESYFGHFVNFRFRISTSVMGRLFLFCNKLIGIANLKYIYIYPTVKQLNKGKY